MQIIHPFKKELEEDYVPDQWTGEHVELRLSEAIKNVGRIKNPNERKGHAKSWPDYQYELEDIRAQNESLDAYEPEKS